AETQHERDQSNGLLGLAVGEADPLGRAPGEPLCPRRLSQAALEQLRRDVGSLGWAAQYLGVPRAPEGGILKRQHFRYFIVQMTGEGIVFTLKNQDGTVKKNVFGSRCRWFQTIDTAMKVASQNDFTVIGTFVLTPDRDLLVFAIWRGRVEVPKQFDLIMGMRAPYPNLLFQAVEDKASGIGLIQQGYLTGSPF